MKPVMAPEADQELEWPDHHGAIIGSGIIGGFGLMEEAYMRDEVLLASENVEGAFLRQVIVSQPD